VLEQDCTAACNRKAHLIQRKPERGLHGLVVFFLLGLVDDRDHQMVDVDLQLVERLERRCVVGFLREIEQALQQPEPPGAAAAAEIAGDARDRDPKIGKINRP
jgi:hypothetical protein